MDIKKYVKYIIVFLISSLLSMYIFRVRINNFVNTANITVEELFKYYLLLVALLILAVFLIVYGMAKYHDLNKKSSKANYGYPQNKSTLMGYGSSFEEDGDWEKDEWFKNQIQISNQQQQFMDQQQLFMNQNIEFINWSIDEEIKSVTPIELGGYDMSQQNFFTNDSMHQDLDSFNNGF